MSARIDLSKKPFGLWVVLSYSGKGKWKCRCRCGTVRDVLGQSLRDGVSCSCGCQQPDVMRRTMLKHGACNTPEYWIWHDIRRRCNDPKRKSYKNYGARGIRVCPRWDNLESGFQCFLSDMGARPSPRHQIERIDNNKGYDGVTRTLIEWSEITGLSESAIDMRIKRGWSVQDAIITPRLQ